MIETKNNGKSMRYTYIGIAIFLLFIGYNYFSSTKHEKNLLKNAAITVGTTYGFPTDARKQSVSSEYWYIVKGKKYTRLDGNAGRVFLNNPAPFTGKRFPVIYDSTNPEYSHMLIDPVDFLKYRITFPDSLNWVRPYFEKNE